MRPLILDRNARAEANRVLWHAEQNHYKPPYSTVPGNDPRFVANFGTYRVAFSYTHSDGKIWRHISVSVPGTKYPNPAATFALADLFGFTGWDQITVDFLPDGWEMAVNANEHCITLAQPIGPSNALYH